MHTENSFCMHSGLVHQLHIKNNSFLYTQFNLTLTNWKNVGYCPSLITSAFEIFDIFTTND